MIKGIAHVAIYTDRFDELITFYKEVLEATEIGRPNTPNRSALLEIGNDVIEVFENTSLGDGVIKHFAVECDNTDEMYAFAIKKGATSHMEPKNIIITLKNEDRNARIAFVRGLAGEQIEFLQYV